MKKGILLIFVLSIISILSVIVLGILNITDIAQKVVSLYHYQIKSQFAAHSGLEFARTRMRNMLTNNPIISVTNPFYYRGEIEDLEIWGYSDVNKNNFPDTIGIAVDDALYPSFAARESFYAKNNKSFSYSGILDDSKEFRSVFKLKIVDLSSTVYIGKISMGTKNFLNNLSQYLNYPVYLGDILFSIYLEKNKIDSFDSLKDILQYPQANVLSNFLSLDGWQYSNLVFSRKGQVEKEIIKSGYDFLQRSLNNISFEDRAPLNINIISKEMIKSNLYNMGANILIESPDYNIDIPTNISLQEAFKILTTPYELIKYATKVRSKNIPKLGYIKYYKIDDEKIDKLVELILKQRVEKPFDTYDSFYNFLIRTAPQTTLSKTDIDIIYTNIYPQTYLQKLNFDKSLKIKVDKSDLTNQTLEFIFFSPGKFYVESVGYVIHKKTGEIVSKDVVSGTFSSYEISTFLTQEDFESGSVTFDMLAKRLRGVSVGPLYSNFRKNKLRIQKNISGFLTLGLVTNGITTDDITYCDTFVNPRPDVGYQDESEYVLFNDGAYSSLEYALKIPVDKNFPIMDFMDFFGVKYKCDFFRGTALEHACGKISKGTFCFWIKPNYETQHSTRMRTLIYLQSIDPKFDKTDNIKYVDSFIVSFVPVNLVKEMVKQYFPMFAPHTEYSITSPFFLWTPKVNPTYLSLINSKEELLKEGQWTHICVQWDSMRTIERSLGAKIIVNGENKTFLFGNDYSTDYARMFRYFAPTFIKSKYIVFGAEENQRFWNFPLEATIDNIIISKKEYTIEQINDFIYKYGRYINKDVSWQSPTIKTVYKQRKALFYTDYHSTDKVNFYISLKGDNDFGKKILTPVTLFDDLPDLSSFKFGIHFDILDESSALFETPFIKQILLFLYTPQNNLTIANVDILLKNKK